MGFRGLSERECNTVVVAPIGSPTDFEFESFVRVLRSAPTNNRLKCFQLIARDGWRRVNIFRQEVIDDLQQFADSGGLVEQFGADAVQNVFAAAFLESGGGL